MRGFELRRLDDNPETGLIGDEIRVAIRIVKFRVTDLTTGNQDTYWEADLPKGQARRLSMFANSLYRKTLTR
jgi:hypothetical protein